MASSEINSGDHSVPSHWADVVIICAKPVEFAVLKAVLAQDRQVARDSFLTLKHFIVVLSSPAGTKYRVMVVSLPRPEAGNVISGITACKLAVTYGPWLVISFGIAGTLSSEVKSNDVVYASEVGYADLRKDAGDSVVWKDLPKERTDTKLLSILNLYAERRQADGPEFKTHEVLMLSSEAVVKSTTAALRRLASSSMADAQVVEMEAFGVYRACQLTILDEDSAPLALAIKGITDASDLTKDDTYHDSAARNAATVIHDLITQGLLDPLSSRYVFRSFPHLRAKHQRTYEKVSPDVRRFIEIASPLLDFKEGRARELTVSLVSSHLISDRPPIFYHFRTTGPGLHWVEFSFLKVFKKLSEIGYPVYFLVTDQMTNMPHNFLRSPESLAASKAKIERVVKLLLPHSPNNTPLVWESQVREVATEMSKFALNTGYDHRAVEELIVQPAFAGGAAGINYQLDLWFKWIAWTCRHDRTGVIFCNPNNLTSYDLLRVFGTFHPRLLPHASSPGGKTGKDSGTRQGFVPRSARSPHHSEMDR